MSRDGVSRTRLLIATTTLLVLVSSPRLGSPDERTSPAQVQRRVPQATSTQTPRRPLQVRPSARLEPTLLRTTLEVSRTGASEFPDWDSSATINGPTSLKFRWTTDEEGVAAGIWKVNPEPATPGTEVKVYASGELPRPPGAGKTQQFSIDFREFTPAVAPKEPYFPRYYVTVAAIDENSDDERAASKPVVVTYRQPGPPTNFTEEMENDPAAEAMVLDVARRLSDTFGIGEPLGPVITGTKTLKGWGAFESDNGPVSIEVHVTTVGEPPVIYVAVPQEGTGIPATYHWFEYTYDSTGLVAVLGDQYPPPDETPPVMRGTRDWCHDDTYDVEAVELDDDPPHWSPFLIRDSNYSAAGRISDIHRYFQRSEDVDKATDRLGRHRRAVLDWDPEELGERALNSWPSVTLRGLLKEAHYPDGDFGGDHTTDFIPPGEDVAPSGGLVEESDPDVFPGMDWDMKVEPDPAYTYLASITRETLQVEIEHFAVPDAWRPHKGEWLQAAGRWVVDCGHRDDDTDDYYTEIHPPELLVTTEPDTAFGSRARVIVTGAWLGRGMEFVVNPPARPSPTSVLRWGEDTTWAKAAELSIDAVPADDPNHLVVTVAKTDGYRPLTLHSDGRVSMRKHGYRGFVRVWWDESLATVEGRATGDGEPARGAFVFHRDATIPNATWRRTRVDSGGYFRIPGLAKGGAYEIVAGASGWDFDAAPTRVEMNDDIVTVHFSGRRAPVRAAAGPRLVAERQRVAVFRPSGDTSSQSAAPGSSIRPATEIAQPIGPQAIQAFGLVGSMLLSVKEPGYSFGVLWNNLGYPESGEVSLHLQGLADWDGEPVASFSSAYTARGQGSETEIVIEGYPTPGVRGARVRARLLLGNDEVGYREADVADGETDRGGVATFRFTAGTHVEESVVELEVLDNPYNAWFKPRVRGNTRLFHPRGSEPGATRRGRFVARPDTEIRSTAYGIEALASDNQLVAKEAAESFTERQEFAKTLARTLQTLKVRAQDAGLRAEAVDSSRGVSRRVVQEE